MITKILIEKKLLNVLTPQELAEFNHLLKTNKQFAEDYKLEADIHQYIKTTMDNQETRKHLKKLHKELESKGQLKENSSILTLKKYLPYAAAALMAGAMFLFYFLSISSNSPEQLFALNYQTPSFSETKRSNNNYEELKTAYESRNFKKVIEIFQNNKQLKPKLKLYLGISYLEIQQTDNAIDVFRSLQSENTIEDQATWYLALCYLKKGQPNNSKIELTKLVDGTVSSTTKRKEKAKQLLRKL